MLRLFISYSRVDSSTAELLIERLRQVFKNGKILYDGDISGGMYWWQTILNQIAQCDVFIYLLSNESVTSPYCQAEFAEAKRLQKPIVTVQIRDKTRLSKDLKEIQYVNMVKGLDDENLALLLGAIHEQAALPKKKRALWTPITALPIVPDAETLVLIRPSIDTPTLELHAPSGDTKVACATILGGIITGVLGIVAVIASILLPKILNPILTPVPTDSVMVESITPVNTVSVSETSAPATQIPTHILTPTAILLLTPNILEIAYTPYDEQSDWTPISHTFEDGVTMMLVPTSCFMMGSGNGDDNERPMSEQCFDAPFWIDQTEVTQAQFAALGGVTAESSFFLGDDHPVENISWFEARDFCVERGARLPTEREWEYAARGPDELTYPWGNSFEAAMVVAGRSSDLGTAIVGSVPMGMSWVGAYDLSGNVWEWTSSLYEPYPYNADDELEVNNNDNTVVRRVLRGGSWNSTDIKLRSTTRAWNPSNYRDNLDGFRCVRPVE